TIFVIAARTLRQLVLALSGVIGPLDRFFVFFQGVVQGFLLFLGGLLIVNKVGKTELGGFPLEAHGVNLFGQRVIGSVVKPRASVINGNLVMADIAHIRTASYPIVRIQDQDRATQVPQLLRRTESRNPRADNDYVVSMGR